MKIANVYVDDLQSFTDGSIVIKNSKKTPTSISGGMNWTKLKQPSWFFS